MPMTITLILLSAFLLLIGVSFTASLGLSSIIVVLIFKPVPSLTLVPQLFAESATSFILLAVPLFIFAGSLMKYGTVGQSLVNLSTAITNWTRGGLGSANIIASMIFGGISGSSLADTATFGSIMVPMMENDGYPKDYAAAVTLTSSSLSVIIPPSILIIMAAGANDISISKALAAGLMPGILLTVLFLIPNFYISHKKNFGSIIPFSLKNLLLQFKNSWTALVAPLIILGSIFSGIVTPTEAAAIAVVYILLIDYVIFRKIKLKQILESLVNSASLTSTILVIATSSAVTNFIIAYEGVPAMLSNFLTSLPGGKVIFLAILVFVLIFMGMMLDSTPAVLIFTPLLLPIARSMGMDSIHFIIVVVFGLAMGLTTPPYGVCLFSVASVCKVQINRLIVQALPFYVFMVIALFLVAFIPQISLFLPKILNL